MHDSEFLSRFLDTTLPFDQWTHRAHVKVAYLLLREHGLAGAIPRMRAGVQAYNAAHGVPDGLHMGYHETVTRAWLTLIDAMVAAQGAAETADAFCDAQPQLMCRKSLRYFYSPARIMSPEAKAGWVEPDLAPLPVVPGAG